MTDFNSQLEQRLVRYCAIDTQRNEASPHSPSTAIQYALANALARAVRDIGAAAVRITEYGAVLATIPATASGPVIGLCAHMDTAPAFNATGVKPRVIRGYNGGDITYPDSALVLSPAPSPHLATQVGPGLVTPPGAPLLGAADKAGMAAHRAAVA